jgi:nucleoid DNA-binding protein|tara:strand:- start:224 stop:508 length:285 start_codon:yes stop_codon:yes gene_type:complete
LVKSKIIKKLNQKHAYLKLSHIENIFNSIFQIVTSNILKNRAIELRGFGRFSTKIIKAKYNARNPRTNEIIYVPEKKKISFKMSKHLKKEINKK